MLLARRSRRVPGTDQLIAPSSASFERPGRQPLGGVLVIGQNRQRRVHHLVQKRVQHRASLATRQRPTPYRSSCQTCALIAHSPPCSSRLASTPGSGVFHIAAETVLASSKKRVKISPAARRRADAGAPPRRLHSGSLEIVGSPKGFASSHERHTLTAQACVPRRRHHDRDFLAAPGQLDVGARLDLVDDISELRARVASGEIEILSRGAFAPPSVGLRRGRAD